MKIAARGSSQEIDVMPWMTRTALELIAQAGIGLSFDSLEEDATPHDYSIAARNFGYVFAILFDLGLIVLHTAKPPITPPASKASLPLY